LKAVFADTFYWAALTAVDDLAHSRALDLSRSLGAAKIVTIDEVLPDYLTFFAGARPNIRDWVGRKSTGPRTEAGKASSSRNAIRTGLYAARDFIRSGEEEEYAQTPMNLMDELTPEGILEQTFATEIMGATWRLRRCRLIEEAFGAIDDVDFEPMSDERTEKQQRSVDRARAQSHVTLLPQHRRAPQASDRPNHSRPARRTGHSRPHRHQTGSQYPEAAGRGQRKTRSTPRSRLTPRRHGRPHGPRR